MKEERKETVGIDLDGSSDGTVSGNQVIGRFDKAITARGSKNTKISDNILRLENMSEVEMNELRETLNEVMEALDVIEKNKDTNNVGEKVLGRVTENAVDILYKLAQFKITGEWNSF